MYDCIIIGMGCAGMSAGIYAKRAGLNTLIIDESAPGGLLNKISIVENYLGFKSISGPDLALEMYKHIRNEKIKTKIARVVRIIDNGETKTVYTTDGHYETKGIIIAIGRKVKKTGLKNEEKFKNKGISYCAICDAPLYKDKDLIVLGGGNSALEESIYLSDFASSVTILSKSELIAEEHLINETKNKNIKIITNVNVTDFVGEESVCGVKLEDGSIMACDGVFIYYGYAADTAILDNLDIADEKGYILVDSSMRTKVNKVYACGDIIKKDVYQIITAASEGAIAALSLKKDINK